jgi:hypothetical protein
MHVNTNVSITRFFLCHLFMSPFNLDGLSLRIICFLNEIKTQLISLHAFAFEQSYAALV